MRLLIRILTSVLAITAVVSGFFVPLTASAASNEALKNILVSKTNGITTLQIWPACTMRYVDHSPAEAGMQLRVRVEVSADCDALLEDIDTEVYHPLGSRMASVTAVTFSAANKRDVTITLNFAEPRKFAVRQKVVGWIDIDVDTNVSSASLPRNLPEPLASAAVPEAGEIVRAYDRERVERVEPRPTSRVRSNITPSLEGNFVVQLGVFDDVNTAIAELLRTDTDHFGYVTDFTVNGKVWHGLQVGFFDSEDAAEVVLGNLSNRFPDSWVRYVQPAEASAARARGELRRSQKEQVAPVSIVSNSSLTDSELQESMRSGRAALIERRYDDAIRAYTSVLQKPASPHRAAAREFIGVAHERNGQVQNAMAEYRAFLAENPEHEATGRVTERLVALQTAGGAGQTMVTNTAQPAFDDWQFYGGVSQYYWRNQQQRVHDGNYLVSDSGVLALGDLAIMKRGERFDLLARLNGAYQFNLVEYDDRGDTGWLSTAYLDVKDKRLGLQGRVGRQNLREAGVLGRFDGVSARYQWRPTLSFGVSGGFPIDSPRYVTDADRAFVAANARIDELWDRVSISAFAQHQTVDGILDRQAIGGQVEYRQGPLSIIGLLDFDTSFSVLNSALMNAAWRLENGWTLNARFNVGAQPYLTTRNALAGQVVRSIDELLQSYSEGQIRTLARDRTAQSSSASLGLTIPLSERFNVTADIAGRQSDATVASGGVASIPDTGTEVSVNTTLVGTNLLFENDLTMLTFRHDATRTRDTSTVTIDARLPLGRALRLNPRLAVSQIAFNESDSEQRVYRLSLRALYRWESLLIDLELGATLSDRDLPQAEWDPFTTNGVEELLGGYVNLGYRWEF